MRKDIADEWVKALRSGKYKQGKQFLKTGEYYCCLGVLCDISRLDKWRVIDHSYYLCKNFVLPEKVVEWAGMKSSTGSFIDVVDLSRNELTELNDSGKTFNEIADIIEKHYEDL